LAEVSPRIVGMAWHRDRYHIPAHDAFVELAQRELRREHEVLTDTLGKQVSAAERPAASRR
jgi:hypothetical protein